MSSTGRRPAANRSLRPAQIPSGMPTTAQNSTEVSTIDSVVMLSSQIPTRSRNSSDTPVKIAMLRPATRQARTQATATNTRKGTASNAASKPPRIWSTGHCRALKNGRMFGTSRSLTSHSMPSSSGSTKKSEGRGSGSAMGHAGIAGRSADDASVSGLRASRSEEHTAELQTRKRHTYADFCLQKKKNYQIQQQQTKIH